MSRAKATRNGARKRPASTRRGISRALLRKALSDLCTRFEEPIAVSEALLNLCSAEHGKSDLGTIATQVLFRHAGKIRDLYDFAEIIRERSGGAQ